jgi:hypothetical protein
MEEAEAAAGLAGNGKTRLRRIKSTTEVEDVHQLEQKNRRKRPDKP